MKRLLLFATLLCIAIPASAATRFGALVEGYENPKAGASAPVSNVDFSVGHLKLTLASGSAAPVRVTGNTVAIFFKGNGTFAYDSDDPVELPVLNRNARSDSHLAVNGDANRATISGPVDEILLYAAGTPLPAIAEGSGAPPTEFAAHVEEFGHLIGGGAAHGMILQNLAAPSTKYVRAEIRSGRDLVVYEYDQPESTTETLVTLHHPNADDSRVRQRLYPTLLSSLPIGRDRKTPPPSPFMLTDVNYTLVADGDNAKLDVSETIARNPERQVLRFDMRHSVLPRGSSERHFHVLSITDEQGHSLPFSHVNDDLLVGVENISGDTVKLKFSIDGDFLVRPNNDNFWQLGIVPWFPQPDLGGQAYTLHSLVKTKKPFLAFAPGKTVRRGEEGDYNVVENVIDKPVPFAVVHAGKYEYTEETRGPLTIRVATYGGKNDRAAKQLTNLAFTIIDYYEYFLGPFPFSEFNIIQVDTWGYGQAPPATMFITNEAFNSLTGFENQLFSQGINERFAHEIAHQYWGIVVKMPSEEEQWLTESFAEYSAALAIKKFQGNGKYDRLVQTWKSNAKEYSGGLPIPLANHISGDPQNAFLARTFLLYAKGPLLLYALHKELGDTQFLTFLKSYQKSFRWKFGTTKDVAGLLQFMTKKDYMPFLDRYFWGTAMPD